MCVSAGSCSHKSRAVETAYEPNDSTHPRLIYDGYKRLCDGHLGIRNCDYLVNDLHKWLLLSTMRLSDSSVKDDLRIIIEGLPRRDISRISWMISRMGVHVKRALCEWLKFRLHVHMLSCEILRVISPMNNVMKGRGSITL